MVVLDHEDGRHLQDGREVEALVHVARREGAVAGDAVIALVAAEAFADLDAPPRLVAPPVAPVPFSPALEDLYIPSAAKIEAAVQEVMDYGKAKAAE